MDLSSYITALLSENDTVIVPGFGAFISVYKPAVIRENDILPPGKEVRFFQEIKNNDGLLAMQIARSKKISYDDAFKRIERATSKIIYQLDKGEKVAFGELGEFSFSENGEIRFQPSEKEKPVALSGFEPVLLEDVAETPEEIINTPEPAREIATENIPEENEVKTSVPEIGNEPVSRVEPVWEGVNFRKAVPHVEPEEQPESKRKKSRVWLWILPGVIIPAVALFFLFGKEKQPPVAHDKNQPQVVKTEENQPETIKPDSIQPADTISVEASQPLLNSGTPRFHIVGGGFRSEENAVKFISQLKNKGIEGTLLGQKGKMFLVGIASYDTGEEAFKELNRRMHENPEWKLWVYRK